MRQYLVNEWGYEERPDYEPGCWVCVTNPDEDDMHFLINRLDVPTEFLDDIADNEERPRTDNDEGWSLVILRIPVRDVPSSSLLFGTVPLGIISKGDVLVTVCHHENEMIPDFQRFSRRKGMKVHTAYDLTLRLIHSSAVWFLKYLKLINSDISAAETELKNSIRNEDLYTLMKIQKTFVFFNTSIRGDEMIISRLRSRFTDEDLVEDVLIELRQALSTVNIYADILSSTMEAFASVINNNVNTIMKRMTSLSIVLAIPTMIGGFYGMNVPISLGGTAWAFAAIVTGSFLLSALSLVVFRRIKWF